MDGITRAYEEAWRQLIKPPRVEYSDTDIGPNYTSNELGELFSRHGFKVANSEG